MILTLPPWKFVLVVGSYFDASDVDWEIEGDYVAENTHLRMLRIEKSDQFEDNEENRENAEEFYRAVFRIISIRELVLEGCPIDCGDMFKMRSPYLEENGNLRNFYLYKFEMDDRSARLLASALSSCGKQSLRKFSFDCHESEINDESAAELVDIMASWRNIKHLSLCFWIDGTKWLCVGKSTPEPSFKVEGARP